MNKINMNLFIKFVINKVCAYITTWHPGRDEMPRFVLRVKQVVKGELIANDRGDDG